MALLDHKYLDRKVVGLKSTNRCVCFLFLFFIFLVDFFAFPQRSKNSRKKLNQVCRSPKVIKAVDK